MRFRSLHVPTPNLAISEFRIFADVAGQPPAAVKDVQVARGDDRRNVTVTWAAEPVVQGYNVRLGIAPDKLHSSWLVYEKTSVPIRSLNTDQPYYCTVEAFDVHGVGPQSSVIAAK